MSSAAFTPQSRVRKSIRVRPRKAPKKTAIPDQWLLNFDLDSVAPLPALSALDCPPEARARSPPSTMSSRYPTDEPSSYAYPTFTPIPQYTESQISAYYQQYQCCPPQPYHVIPDYFPTQPIVLPSNHPHHQRGSSSDNSYFDDVRSYTTSSSNPYNLAPPEESLQQTNISSSDTRSRSPSRARTWTCDYPNCTSTANFTRLADLQRHQATVHGLGKPDFPCTVPRCTRVGDKGFTRRDHLVEHLRNFHHLDIPKRRPGERSANPLGIPNFQHHEQ